MFDSLINLFLASMANLDRVKSKTEKRGRFLLVQGAETYLKRSNLGQLSSIITAFYHRQVLTSGPRNETRGKFSLKYIDF